MIVDLPDTTTSKISKKITALREQGGVIALGRVLTLVVVTRSGLEEETIEAANEASREHPCRISVLDLDTFVTERITTGDVAEVFTKMYEEKVLCPIVEVQSQKELS